MIVLENNVVVLELKGKERPPQADLGPMMAYARDLRAYHADCRERSVHAVLVPTRASAESARIDDVSVVGPEGLDPTFVAMGGSMALSRGGSLS